MEGNTGMKIIGFDEKVEVANKIVADYVDRFSGQSNCETELLIDTCKSMCKDIAGRFGYSITDEEFLAIHGFEMNIMREIRQDLEGFNKKYQDGDPEHRAIIRRALSLAQSPGEVIKNCGRDYIRAASNWLESDYEEKLMQSVNAYVNEHSHGYTEWLQIATEKSKMPMIGQIGHDYLVGNMTYGCKRDTYPQLRYEESWLMDAWAKGDGWAAFTHACLCYFGAVRWKVAVECYGKASELLISRREESKWKRK